MKTRAVNDNPPPALAPEASPPAPIGRLRRAVVPTLVAVSVALPLAIVWAIALMPLGVRAIPDRVIQESTLAPDVVKMLGDRVVRWLVTPCTVVFVVAHLVAVPWALAPADDRKKARRLYWTAIAALTGLAVVLGGASWIWIMSLPS